MGGRASWWCAVAFAVGAGAAHADTQIIDSPQAALLPHGQVRLEIGAGPDGSVLSSARVGLFERLALGFSYGMQEVLGRGSIEANPRPGLQVQVLAVDEPTLPAIAFGFDSQGRGRWIDGERRYERKSVGFYTAVTQHLLVTDYQILTSVSGGLGYSLEPGRHGIDLFLGTTQQLGHGLALMLDYDFGLDDHADLDADRGYLDFGVQWQFGGGNHLRFLLRDLLGNYKGEGQVARELNFYYLLSL
jgi:hypothetical protein